VRAVVAARDTLGETPLWCVETQRLWWLDVDRPAVQRWDPQTNRHDVFALSGRGAVGALALRRAGGLLIARETEVDDERRVRAVVIALHENVRGLEIAMNQSLAMCGMHRLRDLANEIHLLKKSERRRDLVERRAMDFLHGDVVMAGDRADLEHLADRGMIESRLRARFALESRQRFGVGAAEKLERNVTSEAWIKCFEDFRPPAPTEPPFQNIAFPPDQVLGDVAGIVRRWQWPIPQTGWFVFDGHGVPSIMRLAVISPA
jgi:hypothetical protein